MRVEEITDKPFPMIDHKEDIESAKAVLEFSPAVIITKRGKVAGIITKADII